VLADALVSGEVTTSAAGVGELIAPVLEHTSHNRTKHVLLSLLWKLVYVTHLILNVFYCNYLKIQIFLLRIDSI